MPRSEIIKRLDRIIELLEAERRSRINVIEAKESEALARMRQALNMPPRPPRPPVDARAYSTRVHDL